MRSGGLDPFSDINADGSFQGNFHHFVEAVLALGGAQRFSGKDMIGNLEEGEGFFPFSHRGQIKACGLHFHRQMAQGFCLGVDFPIGVIEESRGIDSALSMEAALKLKEVSYIHSEAYAAGELKHGTIALIEDGTLVIALATQRHLA